MGQYYNAVILDSRGWIRMWMRPFQGMKLMEHSYLSNVFLSAFECELIPGGEHHMSRVVWCGDYADPEQNMTENLYHICQERQDLEKHEYRCVEDIDSYLFIVNHTKQLFVDKSKVPADTYGARLHPLSLLTCEGNGRGGGDFRGESPLIGSWSRDVISLEKTVPAGFTEVVFDLVEDQ